MKNLPTGIQSFSDIRTNPNNYIYVDKTQYIHQMFTTGKIYFLSRPRRFGKSLLVSTMENLFNGKKEIFKNIFIYDKWNWNEKNPVIKLDFGSIDCKSPEILRSTLADFLESQAKKFKIDLKISELKIGSTFDNLITKLANKFNAKVVVLIDEYDKAILDNISKPEIREANKEILHDFYQVLKAKDEFIRFVFITGVTKFAGLSVFSGLNNIEDITLDPKYNFVCGYTQKELESYFSDHIAATAQKLKITKRILLDKIKRFYNGYSWTGEEDETVYNPFSTLRFFKLAKFRHFWFATGTPTFIINLLKEKNNIDRLLETQTVSPTIFDSHDPDDIDEISLLFQAGYLTVKKIVEVDDDEEFTLGIPNTEVRKALVECLFSAYANRPLNTLSSLGKEMKKQILDCDSAGFEENLTMLFAKVPHQLKVKREAYYHSLLLLMMNFLGFKTRGEHSTDKGRIDVVMEGKEWTAISELKYSGKKSAATLIKEAMKQIEDKKYYQPYLGSGKIILIAIAYTPKTIKCKMKVLDI